MLIAMGVASCPRTSTRATWSSTRCERPWPCTVLTWFLLVPACCPLGSCGCIFKYHHFVKAFAEYLAGGVKDKTRIRIAKALFDKIDQVCHRYLGLLMSYPLGSQCNSVFLQHLHRPALSFSLSLIVRVRVHEWACVQSCMRMCVLVLDNL